LYSLLKYEGIELHQRDLNSLQGKNFLNDNIVEAWMKFILNEKLSEEDQNRLHLFSPLFYSQLIRKLVVYPHIEESQILLPEHKRHFRVKEYTRNVDIFTKKILVFPINIR
jgi:sentrin-specific protease 7